MIVRKLRLQRGWSQEQLAQLSGLSVRTIQRIERGQSAGLESRKALAAVFEIELTQLTGEPETTTERQQWQEEMQVIEHVRDIKGFYSHAISYVVVISGLVILNLLTSPHHFWAHWPALGWGFGLISHGLSVFEVFWLFGADWERKQVEKRLGRKLSPAPDSSNSSR